MLASIDGADIDWAPGMHAHTYTQIRTHTLSFSLSLSLSLTHTHTHTHTISLSHTHTRRMPMLARIDGADIDWAPGMALLHASR